jgi:SAM-dependent methyltransferase
MMLPISLEPRVCPICGTREGSRLFEGASVDLERLDRFAFASRKRPEYMHWQLWECPHCDLLYVDPAPRDEDLASLYLEADFDSREEARHASRTYAGFLPGILPQLPDRSGAVDIGTGDGVFLRELLAAGFANVAGIEPSSAPIAAANASIRPLIRHGLFHEEAFSPGSLSLITCFQTIEHLADPLSFCRTAWRALKPGGVLFLIGHNRRAFSARVLGRRSPIFDIEHLQLFSPRSFRRLLESAGFARVPITTVFNRYPIRYWAQLFPFPARAKPRILTFLQSRAIGHWVIPLPAGNLAVIAQKSLGDRSDADPLRRARGRTAPYNPNPAPTHGRHPEPAIIDHCGHNFPDP